MFPFLQTGTGATFSKNRTMLNGKVLEPIPSVLLCGPILFVIHVSRCCHSLILIDYTMTSFGILCIPDTVCRSCAVKKNKKTVMLPTQRFSIHTIVRNLLHSVCSLYQIWTLKITDIGLMSREAFLILLAPKILALLQYASRKSACLI